MNQNTLEALTYVLLEFGEHVSAIYNCDETDDSGMPSPGASGLTKRIMVGHDRQICINRFGDMLYYKLRRGRDGQNLWDLIRAVHECGRWNQGSTANINDWPKAGQRVDTEQS